MKQSITQTAPYPSCRWQWLKSLSKIPTLVWHIWSFCNLLLQFSYLTAGEFCTWQGHLFHYKFSTVIASHTVPQRKLPQLRIPSIHLLIKSILRYTAKKKKKKNAHHQHIQVILNTVLFQKIESFLFIFFISAHKNKNEEYSQHAGK